MAQRLAKIREAISPVENPYANGQRAKLLAQSDWESLPAGEQLDRRIQLAVELLRAGQTSAALAESDQTESKQKDDFIEDFIESFDFWQKPCF